MRWAHASLGVDGVAALGHSYGAQAALIYAMEGRPVDAVVSLDSTLENADPKAPWFAQGDPSPWLDRADQIEVPTLLMSSSQGQASAFFDGLVSTDRRWLKVPFLEHNDFISHGAALRTRVAQEARDPHDPAASPAEIASAYELVVRATLAFLQGSLRQQAGELGKLEREIPEKVPGATLTRVSRQPAGASVAEILRALRDRGLPGAIALCGPPPRCEPSERFLEAAEVLVGAGEEAAALPLLRWLSERTPDSIPVHRLLAEAQLAARLDAEAVTTLRRAIDLITRVQSRDESRRRSVIQQLQSRIRLIEGLATARPGARAP